MNSRHITNRAGHLVNRQGQNIQIQYLSIQHSSSKIGSITTRHNTKLIVSLWHPRLDPAVERIEPTSYVAHANCLEAGSAILLVIGREDARGPFGTLPELYLDPSKVCIVACAVNQRPSRRHVSAHGPRRPLRNDCGPRYKTHPKGRASQDVCGPDHPRRRHRPTTGACVRHSTTQPGKSWSGLPTRSWPVRNSTVVQFKNNHVI